MSLLFIFRIRRRCCGIGRKWIILPICKKGDETECSNYRGITLSVTTYKILSNILLSMLTPLQRKLLGIINVDLDATGPLLIVYSAFIKYLKKWQHNERTSSKLMIQFGGSSYEFGIPM